MVTTEALLGGFTDFDVFALGSCLLVEGLLGFLLNGVTIAAFLRVKELRTPSNFLVFCLALADMGISSNATIAAFSSFLRYWPYGSDGCQTHGFHGFLTALSSLNFIAAIAWDRYHQYCTRVKLTWGDVIMAVASICLLSAFWAAMPLLGWGEYDYEPLRTCCTLDYSKGDRNYVSYLIPMSIFNMGIQSVVVLSCYRSIARRFKKTGDTRFNPTTPLKALLFCWGPYGVLAYYAAVCDATLVSPKIRMIAPILAKTSPTCNVFLYALGNENYRGGIWRFLTGETIPAPHPESKSK